MGVDHAGRAYLALATYYRHEGLIKEDVSPDIIAIASPRIRERARLLGALFRVAFLLSAAMPGVLPKTRFEEARGEGYLLTAPQDYKDFYGERLQRRINGLSSVLQYPVEWALD